MKFRWSKNYISDNEIVNAIMVTKTMRQASVIVKLHFSTFKRRAESLGIYKPNQGSKGVLGRKGNRNSLIKLEDILIGNHPSYTTGYLKTRLIKSGIKFNKCEECGSGPLWNGKKITCELHHIDGDSSNHKLENLKILCPNCHSQTDSFVGKNKKNKIDSNLPVDEDVLLEAKKYLFENVNKNDIEYISKENIINAIKNSVSMREAAKKLDLSPNTFKKCAMQYELYDATQLKDIDNSEHKFKYLKSGKQKYGSPSDYQNAVRSNWEESQKQYIPLVLSSDIDFSKFGWVEKLSKILNRPHSKINKWMKRIMPEFYEKNCFKRKS